MKRIPLIVTMLICLPSAALAWDASKVRRAEQELREARSKLSRAESGLQEANSRLQSATQEKLAATAAVKQARETARAMYEATPDLRDAVADQAVVKAEYDRVAEPLLKSFRESLEYRKAVDAADQARARLRSSGASLAQNGGDLSALNQTIHAPAKLEQNAVDQDAGARAAKSRLDTAQGVVAKLREQARERLEQDPQVRQTTQVMGVAERALDAARNSLTAAQRQVSQQRKSVSSKSAAVTAAIRDDEREREGKLKK